MSVGINSQFSASSVAIVTTARTSIPYATRASTSSPRGPRPKCVPNPCHKYIPQGMVITPNSQSNPNGAPCRATDFFSLGLVHSNPRVELITEVLLSNPHPGGACRVSSNSRPRRTFLLHGQGQSTDAQRVDRRAVQGGFSLLRLSSNVSRIWMWLRHAARSAAASSTADCRPVRA